MVNRSQLLLCLLPLVICPVWGANILGLFSTFSPSHLIVHMSMMRTLADRGHNVTIVSMLTPKLTPHENITLILAPPNEEDMTAMNTFMKTSSTQKISISNMMLNMIMNLGSFTDVQYKFLSHPNVMPIYDGNFDLMVLGYVMNDFQLGVAAKLNVPVIVSWVGVPFGFVDDSVGNIYDPSYVASASDSFSTGFRWRLRNFFTWMINKVVSAGIDYQMGKYYKLAFGNDSSLPSFNDVKQRISLLFYNYHSHSEGPVRPTVPQSIEIGGIQIKEKPDPLPKELGEFLDNASNGAIFFSLGTNVKIKYVKPHIVESIYRVFARQKLSIIWKWDDELPRPGNASNIYFNSWLPQDDILAHPNIKLFITHAGKGGVAEAQYHGVPMLALPVFGDQPGNAGNMVASGFGLSTEFLELTEQALEEGITEILQNPVYRNNVRKFSALYRDRPLTARETVIYWTEYVMRHKGAHHLRCPSLQLGFVARHNLDVYALILLILSCSLIVFVLLLRVLIKFIHRRSQLKVKVKSS